MGNLKLPQQYQKKQKGNHKGTTSGPLSVNSDESLVLIGKNEFSWNVKIVFHRLNHKVTKNTTLVHMENTWGPRVDHFQSTEK